jgi:hypothetical protein
MTRTPRPSCLARAGLATLLPASGALTAAAAGPKDQTPVDFNREVGPTLAKNGQAAIPPPLGLDPGTFRFPSQGRQRRLIGVEEGAKVRKERLA